MAVIGRTNRRPQLSPLADQYRRVTMGGECVQKGAACNIEMHLEKTIEMNHGIKNLHY